MIITGSSAMLSPSIYISGVSRICHFPSCMLSGTVTWKRRSTFPRLSATLRNLAVIIAASMTSVATISPSWSLTAFMINTSRPSGSSTFRVSLFRPVVSSSGSRSSRGRKIAAEADDLRRASAFRELPQPVTASASAVMMRNLFTSKGECHRFDCIWGVSSRMVTLSARTS